MSKELDKLIDTTNKIQTCLIGDKLGGQVGLVDKVDCLGEDMCEVKEEIKNLKLENKKTIRIKIPKWISAMAAFIGIYKV